MKPSLSLFGLSFATAPPQLSDLPTTTFISVVPPSYSTQFSQHGNPSSVTPSDIHSYLSKPASLGNPVTSSATNASAPAGGTIDSIHASINFLVNPEQPFTPTISLSDANPSPTDNSGVSSPPPLVCYHCPPQSRLCEKIAWDDQQGLVTNELVAADDLPAGLAPTCQVLYEDYLLPLHKSGQLSKEDSKKVNAYAEYLTSNKYAVAPGTDDWILGGKPGRGGANLQIGLGVGIPLFCLCLGVGGMCCYCIRRRRPQRREDQEEQNEGAVELGAS